MEKFSLLFINMICSFMYLVSGSEEDGVVSVPSEGSVSPGVSSIVNMVRTSMRSGGVRGCIGGATTSGGAVISVNWAIPPYSWGVGSTFVTV